MERSESTLFQIKSNWNKKLDGLGLPRIGRDVKDLPKTFAEYLESQPIDPNIDNQAIVNNQYIDTVIDSKINVLSGKFLEFINKTSELAALQQAQMQHIIEKLSSIESRLEALELVCKARNLDFDEQFEKIDKNLAAIKLAGATEPTAAHRAPEPAAAARATADNIRDTVQAPAIGPGQNSPEPQPEAIAAQPDAPVTPLTPAQQRRVEPPHEPRDHRHESLPSWVLEDLSYDFNPDAIKNMYERFKQYYYENNYTLPDYNGVKIKLRQWLDRAVDNGEDVKSMRVLIDEEMSRRQAIREENQRRHEEYEAHRREVQAPEQFKTAQAGLDNILVNLGKNKNSDEKS